jgi:hypothetical protein
MAKAWTWYVFADGYRVCVRGFSKNELAWEERAHGKCIRTYPE